MTKTPTALRTAMAAAVLLLAGCSDDDGGSSSTTTNAAEAGGADAAASGGEGSGGSGAGVEDREGDALVSQTVALPGSDDEVTVGVQSLTVEGETTVLRLVITPEFTSVSDSEAISLGDAMDVGAQFFGVQLRLLDRENLKEYSVINGDGAWWASSSGEVEATNGEPMYAFAVFAAPEDDIETVDVRIGEQWPEFTDVPVSR